MKNAFLESLRSDRTVIGTLLSIDAPEVAEILALAGFEWLFLDMEHGNFSLQSIQRMCQAVGNKCATLVRVPVNDAVWIKKVLDIGCDGIIVPHVNSKAEVLQVLREAKYPPEGKRSVGTGRASGYGLYFSEYVSNANQSTAIIIQIEDIIAVQNIDEILATPGIDGVLIGPYDLSGSMNMLGEVAHPLVQEQIDKVKRKCKNANIPCGIFVMQAASVQKEIEDGCRFVAVGVDSTMLWNQAQQVLAIARSVK